MADSDYAALMGQGLWMGSQSDILVVVSCCKTGVYGVKRGERGINFVVFWNFLDKGGVIGYNFGFVKLSELNKYLENR